MENATWYQGLIGSLEPRLMYDGAAAATAAAVLPQADGGGDGASTDSTHTDSTSPDSHDVVTALSGDAQPASTGPAETSSDSSPSSPDPAVTDPTGDNDQVADDSGQVDSSNADGNDVAPPAADINPDSGSSVPSQSSGAETSALYDPAVTGDPNEASAIDASLDSNEADGLGSIDDTVEPAVVNGSLESVPSREIAFVDAGLDNYREIVDAISPDMDVYVVDSNVDGWSFVAETLDGNSDIGALHIFGHGQDGSAILGSTVLNQETIDQYADELAAIGGSLTENGDILLYGCNIGEGDAGLGLIAALSEKTGADVAASEDATGAEILGGDWVLERSVGTVDRATLTIAQYDGLLGTPSISQLNGASYTEQGVPLVLDNDVLFANGLDYRGGYLDFYLTDATSADFLTLSTDAGVSTINGAISISGTTVYMGDGSGAVVIGSVDGTYNGQNGERLRINFSNEFTNGDFQTGSDGSTIITGWTAVNQQIHLNGIDQIAGQATPVDGTWPSSNGSIHDITYFQAVEPTRTTYLSTSYQTNGDLAIRMDTGDTNITQGYGVIRGPYVYSNGTVTLQQGDQVSFSWKALSGGDAYDAYGYIIDVNTGATITILDQTGGTGTETAWATSTTTVGASQAGEYRFVFVCGSYDATGGMYVGGELMIDDVTVIQANPANSALTDAQVGAIAHRVLYNNTSNDPGTLRTLEVSAQDSNGYTGSAQTTISISQLNDAPSFTDSASLASIAEDAANPAGSSVSSLFSGKLSDPDNSVAPYDSLAGIVVGGDASSASQGIWQYSTDSGGSWYAVGSVSASGGLVLNASSLLRFLPGENYNGTPGALSVYAVDSSYTGSFTSGTARQTFDTTSDGSGSAVSAAAVSLTTTVSAVNDAPVMNVVSGQTIADTSALDDFAQLSGVFSATDIDSSGFSYVIANPGATGDSLTSVMQGSYGTLTLARATGAYSYTPDDMLINALAAGATVTDTFSISVSDGQLSDTGSLVITLSGHDDSPIFGAVEGSAGSGQSVIADGTTAPGASIEILNNGALRFGDGTIDSVNASTGMLEQPWYYDTGTWYKLTFSSYQLNFAIAAEGDGSNEWNLNGTVNMSPTFTNAMVDDSGFYAAGNYGTIIYSGYITLGSTDLKVTERYELTSDGSFIKATTQITNVDTETATNLRVWVGTQDDWIALTDAPAKQKGNIVDGEFVPITSADQEASAIKVYSGDTAVLFYSTSDQANTIIHTHYNWNQLLNINPQNSIYDQSPDDGNYGMFVRMNDLAPGQSESFDWFYAAGAIEDISGIISNVAQAAAVGLAEGNGGLTSSGTYTVSDIDSGDVVNVALTAVAASQQDMSGNPVSTSSFQPDSSALLAMMSVSPEQVVDVNHTQGDLTWLFDSGSESFDYLQSGERLVLTYTLTATDSQGETATQTVEVTINGSDDRPVNTVPGSQTIDEDTSLVFSSGNGNGISLGITDDEVITTTLSVAAGKGSLTITNPGSVSVVNNSTSTVQLQGSRAEINAALQELTYNPAANGNGAGYATITVVSSDGVSQDTDTITINVTPVDDLPVASDMTAIVGPNSKQLFSEFVPAFVDVDNDQPVALRLLNDPTVGQFEVYCGSGDRLDDANWSVIAGISAEAPLVVSMADLNNYRFNAGENEGLSTNINWQVQTAGNTTGSGWSNVADGVITVLDPNNNAAPVVNIKAADGTSLNNGGVTIVEDGNLPGIKLIFSDDYTPEEFMQGIIQSSNTDLLDNTGITYSRSTTNSTGDTVTLTFTPKANMYGSTTITLGAYDGEKSTTQSFVLTVSPVNETPVTQDFLRVIDEDHAFSFGAIDPATIYTDSNDANANADAEPVDYSEQMAIIIAGQQENATEEQQTAAAAAMQTLIDASLFPKQFVIETLPEHGSLVLDGEVIATTGTAIATANLGKLIYQPDQDFYGTDSFNWHGVDQAPQGGSSLVSATKVATFTVNPINDAPVISNGPDSTGFSETNQGLGANGTLTVNDVDTPDTVVAQVTNLDISGSRTNDPFAPDYDTLFGMLAVSPVTVLNSSTSTATLGWEFSSDRVPFDFLAKDETLVLTYTIQVTDNNATEPEGAILSDTETVTVTITGTNDAPVISVTANDADSGDLSEADEPLTSQGTLSVGDLDTTDLVQITKAVSANQKDRTGQEMVSDRNEPSNEALLSMLSITGQPIDGASQTGAISWAFDSGYSSLPENFDYLAAGEQLILSYTLTATDSQGAEASHDIVFTITGANDAPVITVETGNSDGAALVESDTTLASEGSLTVLDLDTTDIVSISTGVSAIQKYANGSCMTTDALQPSLSDLLAMFNATGTPVDGDAQSGRIDWNFDSSADGRDVSFDYLAAGQQLVLTYTLTATDSQGATTTKDVTITITGTNDAPVLTAAAPRLMGITEDMTGNPGQSVASFLGVADLDSTDPQGIAIYSADQANGSWQYSLDGGGSWRNFGSVSSQAALLLGENDKIRFVPNGENGANPSFQFRGWDQSSGVAGAKSDVSANGGETSFSAGHTVASLTVAAVNDAPTSSGSVADQTARQGMAWNFGVSSSLFSDIDAGDSFSFSASGLPPGVSFNGGSLTFSGTPAQAGVFHVTIQAQDQGGAVVSTSFTLIVDPAITSGSPPPPPAVQGYQQQPAYAPVVNSGEVIDPSLSGGASDNVIGGIDASLDGSNGQQSIGGIDVSLSSDPSFLLAGGRGGTSSAVDGIGGIGGAGVSGTVFFADQSSIQQIPGDPSFSNSPANNINTETIKVSATGEVVFDHEGNGKPASGLFVKSMTVDDSAFKVEVSDSSDTAVQAVYTATLENGTPLPGWMTIDPASGTVQGNPPPGVETVELEIVSTDINGNVKILHVKIRFSENGQSATPELVDGAMAWREPAYQSFMEQLAEAAVFQQYGEKVLSALAAA